MHFSWRPLSPQLVSWRAVFVRFPPPDFSVAFSPFFVVVVGVEAGVEAGVSEELPRPDHVV